MNFEWIGKTVKKTIRSKKNEKTVKIKMKLPRKLIFVQTPFSRSTLKLE